MESIKIIAILLLLIAFSGKAHSQNKDVKLLVKDISSSRKYGFKSKVKYSIKVGTVKNEYRYMELLSGPKGEAISYKRLGSCCRFSSKVSPLGTGFLDKWEVSYEGLKEPIIIYLNGYEYNQPKCPKGLKLKE